MKTISLLRDDGNYNLSITDLNSSTIWVALSILKFMGTNLETASFNNFNSVDSGIENGVIGVIKVADYAPPKNKAKNVVRHLQKNTIVRISFPTIGALEKYVRPISKYV